MLLTIDVGNTNMVFGVFQGKTLLGVFRLKTDPLRTSDEIGLLARGYFDHFGLDAGQVEAVVIASVVPPVMHTLTSAIVTYFDKRPLVVDEDLDPGLPYGVTSDERLGPDRAVADVAAMEAYGAPILVLDFGTATTLDALSREGTYLGGCITAGVRLSTEVLFQKTAHLPNVELAMPDKVLGCTAIGQIQAGVLMGYVGTIEFLIRRAKAEMGDPPEEIKVVATGGLACMVAEHTKEIDRVDAALVLNGLRIIYEKREKTI